MFKMICVKLQGKTSIYIHANTAWINKKQVFIWTGFLKHGHHWYEFRKLLNWSLIASYLFKRRKSILTHRMPMFLF